MWLIIELWGAVCAIFTYFTVAFVYLGFVRIGIWEKYHDGETSWIYHLAIFQFNCFMIYMCHFKCMTT